MQLKTMKILNWLFIIFGICGLIGVRIVEDELFYDPFLEYFRRSSQNLPFPRFEWGKLVVNHLFRFFLNLVFSALVIHFMFKNKSWTFQGILLISLVFFITLPIYLYCLYSEFSVGELFSFYMRRFVIQPVILLLIIPLFYYRKQA